MTDSTHLPAPDHRSVDLGLRPDPDHDGDSVLRGGPDRPGHGSGPRPGRVPALLVGGLVAVVLVAFFGISVVTGTSGREVRLETRILPASVTRIDMTAEAGDVALYGPGATTARGIVFPTGASAAPRFSAPPLSAPPSSAQPTAVQAAGAQPSGLVLVARLSGVVRMPALDVQISGDTARVSSRCPLWSFWDCGSAYFVAVPSGRSVTLRTSAGDVSATGLDGPARLYTSAGDVVVTRSRGAVDASSAAGDVRVLESRSRSVRMSSSAGDLTLEATEAPDDLDAQSSAGDVRVLLPADSPPYATDVSTYTGDRDVTIGSDPRSQRRLRVATAAGNVTVHRTEP
ncbi:DUF4097 family beta strand repeat-containing protein [Frankia sp. R82]|uniref:DUF4097 family beta strand repeat-containing protein n=1 Tax=Frankia sp. R82 TaxID=2950553 RepID=UPI00204498A4|nr:DUF4097 family beta strand repeat-containing protein [Frankia sp. R82]MCM3882854.1 DUF4097 domain-containing protein [Frankia sp. R82]